MVTKSYGTWNNLIDMYSSSVEDTISSAFGEHGSDGFDFEAIVTEYRNAINEALPQDFTLVGNEFYGPTHLAGDAPKLWDFVTNVGIWETIRKHENA